MSTDPRYELFRSEEALLVASEMGWTYDDLIAYSDMTYDPRRRSYARALPAGVRTVYHRFMAADMELARRLDIRRLDALSVFVSSIRDQSRDQVLGTPFTEDRHDVTQLARLLARIGWDTVVEARRNFPEFLSEPCRENVEMYLDAGVSGRFVCHVPVSHPGGESFTVREALLLEKHGVPPEYANAFTHVMGEKGSVENIVKMWEASIPLEYATA